VEFGEGGGGVITSACSCKNWKTSVCPNFLAQSLAVLPSRDFCCTSAPWLSRVITVCMRPLPAATISAVPPASGFEYLIHYERGEAMVSRFSLCTGIGRKGLCCMLPLGAAGDGGGVSYVACKHLRNL